MRFKTVIRLAYGRASARQAPISLELTSSYVVRAGLPTMEREEQQYEAKLAALWAAIDEGDASGIAKGQRLWARP